MKFFFTAISLLIGALTFSQENQNQILDNDSKFSMSFAIGPSFRLGRIPDNLEPITKQYLTGLKTGVSYDLNLNFSINQKSAFGFKFNLFHNKGSFTNAYIQAPNGNSGYGTLSDNIKIYFIGPTYSFFHHSKINDFYANLGLGFMGYIDDANYLGSYKITGETLGFDVDATYYIGLSARFQVGPKVALFGGSLSDFDIEGPNNYHKREKLEKDNIESLWRLDLSIAFRYKF